MLFVIIKYQILSDTTINTWNKSDKNRIQNKKCNNIKQKVEVTNPMSFTTP